MSTPDTPPKLKILMLHGFTQTGRLFDLKTKALQKALAKHFPPAPKPGHLKSYPGGIELYYPTGPIKLDVKDIPGHDVDGDSDAPEAFGWWRRKDDREPFTYAGLEEGMATVADLLKREGPFAGALGFSQGGAAAGMVAALLEPGRREAFEAARAKGGMRFPEVFEQIAGEAMHPPLKFAVSYSGFAAAANPLYEPFYEPLIQTPMLHFLGTMDTVVSEERSMMLADACVDGRGKQGLVQKVVHHPGGHFLPSSNKECVAALVAFIREAVGEAEEVLGKGKQEERVEDMDLPF